MDAELEAAWQAYKLSEDHQTDVAWAGESVLKRAFEDGWRAGRNFSPEPVKRVVSGAMEPITVDKLRF